jgi:hypothetical protein
MNQTGVEMEIENGPKNDPPVPFLKKMDQERFFFKKNGPENDPPVLFKILPR